ncbi:MAG: heat-inducible transcriptional repressor HrcA [Acidimicrobiia bacterium]|nr:heat-inducible transcriptional repressor HrcA [Acidimicrobiia bacterium]
MGGALVVRSGRPVEVVASVAAETGAEAVHATADRPLRAVEIDVVTVSEGQTPDCVDLRDLGSPVAVGRLGSGDVTTPMLDERKAAILRAVIEEYIDTAQPVGSSAVVAAADVRVSPATVRNDMAVLETEGFLTQPHTSAGRVPTEKGYRHFVDHLDQAKLASSDRRQVAAFFGQMKGEIEIIMRDTAGLLADLTDYAAVVVDDAEEAVDVRSVQLVGLADRIALAVIVLANGQIIKQTVEFDRKLDDNLLSQADAELRAAFEGHPVTHPGSLEPSGNKAVDMIAAATYSAITDATSETGRVYVDGTARVVNAFQAVESVGRVLTILEQQLVVVSLLADVIDRGLTVAIGSETGMAPLSECSLVVSPYEIDGEHAGSIAVLGPTRMNYQQALSAVAAVSHQLGNRLSEG